MEVKHGHISVATYGVLFTWSLTKTFHTKTSKIKTILHMRWILCNVCRTVIINRVLFLLFKRKDLFNYKRRFALISKLIFSRYVIIYIHTLDNMRMENAHYIS